MTKRGTVFLVDDDPALRRATTRLLSALEFEVRAFASAEEFLSALDPRAAGCLLLDLRLPGRSGLDLQRTLEERGVSLPIVFLTGHGDVPASVHAMKRGAVDFLQKPAPEEQLVEALDRAIARDEEGRIEREEVAELERRYASLTPREREVMAEMVAGQLNKQAAYSLGIAERTVKLHRSRVFGKMRADSLADLVRMAGRLGLGPGRT